MRLARILLVCALAAGTFAHADELFDRSDCRHKEPRRVAAPAAGIAKVVVHATAGSLTVTGDASAREIAADGTACASDAGFLDRIQLTVRREGSELHVKAEIPERTSMFGFGEARLDFAVTLPAALPVTIVDGSGWLKVTNTGATSIDDGSGDVEVRNVRGPLSIRDGSGSILADDVQGSLRIDDGSGEIVATNVSGDAEVRDGSGSIRVAQVSGSVRIPDDGSGSIDVSDAGGDFTVGRKGSGSVTHDRVKGTVDIPRRR